MTPKQLTAAEVTAMFVKLVDGFPNQRQAAHVLGFDPSNLHKLVNGALPSKRVCELVGVDRTVVYVFKRKAK